MSSPYLVTGATGNVGRPLVHTLTGQGVAVRAASRRPGAATNNLVQPVRFNFTDPATFDAAFAGVATMFLVRPPDVTNTTRDLVPALKYAAATRVQHVVFLSVQGADRLRVVPHARIEQWLRGSGLAWTFLRASFFDQNLITVHGDEIRNRSELVMPSGNGRTAFVDANDVAAVAAHAMLHPDQHADRVWTPTGSEALSYGEVAGIMTAVLGRPIRYTQPGLLSYAVHALGTQRMPAGLVAVTAAVYSTARLGLAAGLTDHVQQVLGRPATTHDRLHPPRTSRLYTRADDLTSPTTRAEVSQSPTRPHRPDGRRQPRHNKQPAYGTCRDTATGDKDQPPVKGRSMTTEEPERREPRDAASDTPTSASSDPGPARRSYTLIGPDGRPYQDTVKGILGGPQPDRVYGRLTCPAAAQAIAAGGYTTHRVFFASETHAIAAGYRPCAVCLPHTYAYWQRNQPHERS